MKGLIIKNSFILYDSIKSQIESLKRAFNERGIKIDVRKSSDISYTFSSSLKSKKYDYDFCIFLDKDIEVARILERNYIRLFNGSKAIEICDDKRLTIEELSKFNIRSPKTIFSFLNYSNDKDSKMYLDIIKRNFEYPIIVKEAYGSQGKQVYLIHNDNEFNDLYLKIYNKPFLIQEFIKESKGKDIRVIVIGNSVIGAMQRYNPNDFRSNIALGGTGSLYKLSKKDKDFCIKIASSLGLDYCGIDLLKTNNRTYVCEVNSNAFFEEFKKITKINVEDLYVNYIIDEVKKVWEK